MFLDNDERCFLIAIGGSSTALSGPAIGATTGCRRPRGVLVSEHASTTALYTNPRELHQMGAFS